MTIFKIAPLPNGAHDNQIISDVVPIPDGWALLPEPIATPNTENYPFADITTETVLKDSDLGRNLDPKLFGKRDSIEVVTEYKPLPMPEPEPEPELTPAQKRENAYNTDPIIEWDGQNITVTEAAQQWEYYAAEGSDKATTLTELIAAAKAKIREQYPDTTEASDV